MQDAAPSVFRVVIRIEREIQACLFESVEQVRKAGQSSLEKAKPDESAGLPSSSGPKRVPKRRASEAKLWATMADELTSVA